MSITRAMSSLILLVLSIATVVDAHARKDLPPESPTDSELALLPQACHARLRGGKEEHAAWRQKIGRGNFDHLHHYCFALNYINRARFTFDKKAKRYFLQRADGNLDYVLRHWPQNSPLRPDAEAGKRQVQMMMRTL